MMGGNSNIVNANGDMIPFLGRGTFTVNPDDDNDLPNIAYGIRVGTAGTLRYLGYGDAEDTIELFAGETLPVIAKKVFATGTTCTGIKGFLK